ncbi:MAG TPA: hypothetical protein VHB27_02010 [Rhodopila sp.]|nr:hypothetical protein [Rhodopila sp.]
MLLFGIYFLLAGEVSGTEMIAGAAAASATTAFIVARRRRSGGRLSLMVPPSTILQPLASLIPDTIRVAGALARVMWFGPPGDRGTFLCQGPVPQKAVGPKGVWILSQSFTPKNFVLDDADGSAIVHCLAPGDREGARG